MALRQEAHGYALAGTKASRTTRIIRNDRRTAGFDHAGRWLSHPFLAVGVVATPRELFIPDRALWVHDDDVTTPIDRDTDPDTWMRAIYSNDAVVIQFDDGTPDGEGDATSSSMPSIMLAMRLPTQCPLRPDHRHLLGRHRALGLGGTDSAWPHS